MDEEGADCSPRPRGPATVGPGYSLRHPWALVHKTTYAPMIYMSLYIMVFDAGRSITWAIGRGLGHGNLEFFGPQMTLAYWLDAISQDSKNS